MKWSFKLGRILGIDVYIHFTFLLVLGFLGLAHWMVGRSIESAVTGVTFFLLLFGCVLLHEYGHALMARRYDIKTRDITLLPIGGVARLERMPDNPVHELWVALAGPAVNVVIAVLLFGWLTLTGTWEPLSSLSTTQGNLVERLLAVNVFLVLFNLLPAFPMDGGRVLRSLLALRLEYARATRIAATIGQGMAVLFGFVGLFGNPMLLFIAFFVWIGAAQEAGAAEMKSALAGIPVREAMVTEFSTLSPQATLGDAAQLILAGSQRDFPVVDRGNAVGVLVHEDLFEALGKAGEHASVESVMQREFQTANPGDLLDFALSRLRSERGTPLLVMESGGLRGLLTTDNLGEFLMIRAALAGRRGSPLSSLRVPPVIWTPGRPSKAR
ncbi:MAG: site-2 protease family protein [Verrucomicrobia bacterium]|nr:site-2 protease family protein [Verrucomicrobiota bacterium]